MNEYKTGTAIVHGAIYTPTDAAPAVMTMESVVAAADQLEAASRDVAEAWRFFQYGPTQDKGVLNDSAPRQTDKLNAAGDSLRQSIQRLAALAEQIRSRS